MKRPEGSAFTSDTEVAAHRMRALGLWGPGAATPPDVVKALVAVQAQDHAMARWSLAQRTRDPPRATAIDEAFDRGEVVRTHVLRPTWHYVSPEDLRWLVRMSGPRIVARYSRYWAQFGLDPGTLAASTDAIADAVEGGPCTRSELGARLGRRGNPLGGAELAARVMHAELHMAVCSGPMRGRQHTYVAFEQRARGGGPQGEEALGELASRYFTARGPATVRDFSWWAGLPMAEARRGWDIAARNLEVHEHSGRRYLFGGRGGDRAGPAIDLLQCYDEAVVSYRESRDVLRTPRVSFEPLRREQGFLHPVLRNGQLAGRWRVARNGKSIEVRLADHLSPAEQDLLAQRTEALRQFLAGR